MFLSNPAKSFLACLFILTAAAGCGWLKQNDNTAAPVIAEPKAKQPFKTKEPDNFQCEIVETAGSSIRRTRLARIGNWRRIDYDLGGKQHRAVLRTDKEYLLDIGRNTYAESPSLSGNTGAPPSSELTHELLTIGSRAEFEEIGREGNIIRFRTKVEGFDASEIILLFDETIGLPIKQEFFSVNGDERSLEYTVEMLNFHAVADEGLFSLPTGARKITPDELYKQR